MMTDKKSPVRSKLHEEDQVEEAKVGAKQSAASDVTPSQQRQASLAQAA